MRVLGLDVGDRRIGVALSDETGTLASGLDTIVRVGPRQDLETIAELVRAHGATEVVVGLPLNMDGTVGPQAEKVNALIDGLRKRVSVPVQAWDERLTTVEAHEQLRKAGVSWSQRAALIDKVSAVIILQEYLDQRRSRGGGKA